MLTCSFADSKLNLPFDWIGDGDLEERFIGMSVNE